MGFLAPILGGLAGPLMGGLMGGKSQGQANQNNQQQQQQAIQQAMQAWQQAMGGFENWMGQNPGPFAGGFNVRQPGQIGANPYQPFQMPAGGIFGGQMQGGPATQAGGPFGFGSGGQFGGGRQNPVGGGSPMRPQQGNWWGPGSNWWKNFRGPGEWAENHPFAGGGGGFGAARGGPFGVAGPPMRGGPVTTGGGGFNFPKPPPMQGSPVTGSPMRRYGFGSGA